MATDNLKYTLQAFWRRQGEGDITITYPETLSLTPKRFSLSICYDYYWIAGIILFRVLDRITYGSLLKHVPYLITEVSAQDLTGTGKDTYALNPTADRLIDDCILLENSTTYDNITLLNFHQVMKITNSQDNRKKPSVDNIYAYLQNPSTFKLLPANSSATTRKISFRYIKEIPRLALSSSASDIWTVNFMDLLLEGMIALSSADKNEYNVEQLYMSKLSNKFQILAQPNQNQDNFNLTDNATIK